MRGMGCQKKLKVEFLSFKLLALFSYFPNKVQHGTRKDRILLGII